MDWHLNRYGECYGDYQQLAFPHISIRPRSYFKPTHALNTQVRRSLQTVLKQHKKQVDDEEMLEYMINMIADPDADLLSNAKAISEGPGQFLLSLGLCDDDREVLVIFMHYNLSYFCCSNNTKCIYCTGHTVWLRNVFIVQAICKDLVKVLAAAAADVVAAAKKSSKLFNDVTVLKKAVVIPKVKSPTDV